MVSIIIPTYNRAGILNETLQSVVQQTAYDWECIVVDDGSTDNTDTLMMSWLEKDSRFRYVHRPENRSKGPSSCRNFGAEKAKSDYLMFLDSDDLLLPECISNRMETVKRDPEQDFWIFPMSSYTTTPELKDFVKYETFTASDFLAGFIMMEFPWNVTAPLYSRFFFLKMKGFSEDIRIFEDPEIAIRSIITSEGNFKFINQSDAFYRVLPASESIPAHLSHYVTYYRKVKAFIDQKIVPSLGTIYKDAFLKILRSTHINTEKSALITTLQSVLLETEDISAKEQRGIELLKSLQQRYYKKPGYYKLKQFINERYFL